jgi:hypothetical protein
VQFRSPLKSNAYRGTVLRVFAGAVLCASAIAGVVLLAPVVGRWVGGSDRPAAATRIAGMPNDSGLAGLGVDTRDTRKPRREHAKPQHHRHAVLTAGNVVILAGDDPASPKFSPATPAPAHNTGKRPDQPQVPRSPAKKVKDKPSAIVLPKTPAPPASAAAASGIVRLSVESVGIVPNAAGEPELQAKLGIAGAAPADALPPTVTLHLRPQIPAAAASSDAPLALNTTVDMVDAPRTAPTDPALRLRVRMTIAAAPAATTTPTVQEPGPGDGKSNVIGLTVALESFTKVEDTPPAEPTTPPTDQGPSDPTTPPSQGPSEPTMPSNPGPSEPTTPPTQGPTDPTTPPDQAPSDPTTPPDQAPTDPTTPPTDQPVATTPAPIPPTEILIPVGPIRPNAGTTTVPVTPTTGDTAPAADPIPIEVIVEELPPEEPPAPTGDVATPAVQDPAPEVVAPPADPDPTPTPMSDSADPSVAAVVATDVAPPDASSS